MKRIMLWLFLLCSAGTTFATVPLVPYTVTYTCTGGFGPYAFTFPISDPTALTVNLNGVILASTNYTIIPVNNNYNNGGSVTLAGGYPCSSGTLILTRTTPIDQLINFYDNMPSLPMITGRSVDKLTEIAQELEGLIGQIAGGSGVTSIQMQNSGVNYGTPLTGLATMNFVGCTVSGVSPSFTITCAGGGSVTSVSGTPNQIDVATGTTTPVISLDNNITFPGAIKMNPNAADFSAASSFRSPVAPGAVTTATGQIAYDSTAKSTHFQTNNADSIAVALAANPAGSKCLHTSGTTGLATETSGDCATLPSGNGVVRVNSGVGAAAELSGDATTSGSNAVTLATVNSNVGSFTSANITVNAKGLITAAANGAGGGTVTSIATTSPITGGTITTTGTIACPTCVVASSPGAGIPRFAGSTQTVTSAELSGAVTTSGSNVTTLATSYRTRSCEIVWGGSGTSFALTSGDDAVANNSCFNKIGVTETITGVYCKSDNGSNATTVNPTFGATGTGTTICSGALTCGSSNAYSSTCTVSNASLTNGSGIDPAMGGSLTGTNIHVLITYTLP